MLRIENLKKTYDTGDQALRDVSFEAHEDEIVSIIGPSGAGKSTIVRCINRLVEPTDGSVIFNGTDIVSLSDNEIRDVRKNIGMVFQEYSLVERLTVMENVMSGRLGNLSTYQAFRRKYPESDVRRARETLNRVGLDPAAFEDKRADELSGGERQRVGIARAVVQQPEIILADEPTSSLDPDTSRAVMGLLTDIAQSNGIPVIMNIHDVQLAKVFSDRIIGLHNGSIVFDAPPSELNDQATDRIYKGNNRSNGESERGSSETSYKLERTDV